MIDLFVSLLLTAIVSIVVKRFFADNGMAAFPILMLMVILVASYAVTAFVHSLFFAT